MKQILQSKRAQSFTSVEVVAGCVIRKDGKYLLVQEKQAKAYGLWNLPAGHVDKGETIKRAAVREVKEEVGYDVRLKHELMVTHENANTPVKHAFAAEIIGGNFKLQTNELLDAKWYSYSEIGDLRKRNQLRAKEWIWGAITKVEESTEV
jgi:8-oxo-dGTP diphosphatase